MSRGIGRMQQLIVGALSSRPGGDAFGGSWNDDFVLAQGIHDLRQVSKELARTNGGIIYCSFIEPKWEASFSRAIRSLQKRKMLEFPSLLPLQSVHRYAPRECVYELSDGVFHVNRYRQRRFVRVLAENPNIHNT